MSNRATRRAAERLAQKAAKQQQQEQATTNQAETHQAKTMAAAAGASSSPNVDFAEEPENNPTEEPPRRHTSDAQRAANRANAQKSTGPVTAEGRAKSCLNAIKTGLTGQTVLLPTDDAHAYQAHLNRLFSRHSPATDEEHTLVQMIADSEWRILRIPSLEASIYAVGTIKLADLHPEEKDPAVRATLIRGEVLLAYRRDLSNLALQERRLRNQHKSDLEKLTALQKDRKELEKKNDKGEIQKRMLEAIRMMGICHQFQRKFNPDHYGFEFSVSEITHCHQAIVDADTRKQSEPCVADLLAALRNGQKGAQAAA